MNRFLKATGFTHLLLTQFLKTGQRVIDATAGNGHDTLFLAQAVGSLGFVYAFDIQEKALIETRKLLIKHNCLQQVKLIHDGHEKIRQYLQEPINAIIYNLGYLPGGNKEVITKGEITLLSLQQSMEILSTGGVISLTVYPGHAGGKSEAILLEDYLSTLSPHKWQVLKWCRINGDNVNAPFVLLLLKA